MPIVSSEEFVSTTFDYLIVGGGTAGLVVAARLSEDPSKTVGVVEAGQYRPDMPQINVPGYLGRALGNPEVDWAFMTVPQPHMNGRSIFTPRGKVLGGTSALNFMGMSRASTDNYDAHEQLGNAGWNWQSWLKYFKKSEHMHGAPQELAQKYHAEFDPASHGSGGPLQVSYPGSYLELHNAFFSALQSTGVDINPDSISGNNIGGTTGAQSIDPRTATRSYSTSAYWEPNATRPNLQLITGAQATRVLFERGKLLRATGLEFVKDKEKHVVNVSREIVLSAGTFQTPQLLELSGIGNKEILACNGVPTLLDLPTVGENLQDHLLAPMMSELIPTAETFDDLLDKAILEKNWAEYLEKRGKFSCLFWGLSYINAESFATNGDLNKMRSHIDKTNLDDYTTLPSYRRQTEIQRKWLNDPCHAQAEFIFFPGYMNPGPPPAPPAPAESASAPATSPEPGKRYLTIFPVVLHPFSRGSVHVASADPLAPPCIDPRYLSHPFDLELFVSAFRYGRKLAMSGELGQLFRGYVKPGPDATDEEIVEHIKSAAQPVYHPIGTAGMLPREAGGVVDDRLLVYGTANLRICDASVLPLHVSCHPQATVYALAEKAADIIAGIEGA